MMFETIKSWFKSEESGITQVHEYNIQHPGTFIKLDFSSLDNDKAPEPEFINRIQHDFVIWKRSFIKPSGDDYLIDKECHLNILNFKGKDYRLKLFINKAVFDAIRNELTVFVRRYDLEITADYSETHIHIEKKGVEDNGNE